MVDPKEYWASKANKLKSAGKFEEAVKILDKITNITKDEYSDNYWYDKSKHFFEIGEYEQAEKSLLKDLETGHKSYENFFLFGKILYKLKKFEESLECYNKAFEEYSSKKLKQKLKIEQMKKIRRFEEAIKYSDLVKQTKGIDSDYWHHKGKTFLRLKKIDQVFFCFEKALELDKKNAELLYDFAVIELRKGNKKKSMELLESACLLKSGLIKKLLNDGNFTELKEQKRFQKILESVLK